MKDNTDRLFLAMRSIAGMRINENTDFRQLCALMKATAAIAAREFCCGDAVYWNESNGTECAATRSTEDEQ